MKYVGSKNRYAKHILPIVLENRTKGQYYIEPFVGGCNIIDKVKGNRIGNDKNYYLIEMWRALQNGWTPPHNVSEDMYYQIKKNKSKFPAELVGFVGIGCSYSGKWFGGYARGKNNKGIERNYADESARNVTKQIGNIQGIIFINKDYNELDVLIPNNSIIYCDPPYANTTKYKNDIDHNKFWKWCRKQHKNGHSVFVSEYNAPQDFKCVWKKTRNDSLDKDTGSKKSTEKLFVPK